ncbi:Nephrocystin-3 [Colletotrichum fructicola]|nr:Nephrocystin-3 [Colletotrichum fructicola]
MSSHPPRRRAEDVRIAVICALPREYDAVILAFDEIWSDEDTREPALSRHNHTLGRIGIHHVVLALLPNMGKACAANEVVWLRSEYAGLEVAFLTGICGAVPKPGTENEILLGDVVIGESIVQYDLGRQYPSSFSQKGDVDDSLSRLSKDVRTFLATYETHHGRDDLQQRITKILAQIQQVAIAKDRHCYNRPAAQDDILFEPNYLHKHRDQSDCVCHGWAACDGAIKASCKQLKCDVRHQVSRKRLESKGPELRIHIGRIGSGDTVMKSGKHRDRVAAEHGIIAFEMEGAGVWEEIPCIIVKGVCDYADSHKNKSWQDFAAAMAASATKALLERYVSRTSKKGSDMSLVDSPSHTFTLASVLFNVAGVNHFVGRGNELRRLHKELEWTGKRRTAVLHGLGGMGKTQLSIEYTKRHESDYSAILWMNARDETSLKHSFKQVAERIIREHQSVAYVQNAMAKQEPNETAEAVKRWLNEARNNRWLIVYDNYDDVKLWPVSEESLSHSDMIAQLEAVDSKAYDIRPYFPETDHGAILVTTRSSTAELGQLIQLSKLGDVNDSLEILQSTSNRANLAQDPDATALARRLDGLPLALSTAGAYLKQVSRTCGEYLRLALYSTWKISLEHIQQQSLSASMLLGQWAYFDNDDLCERDGERVTGIQYKERAWTAMRCVASHVPSTEQHEFWSIQRRLLRHADQCLKKEVMDVGEGEIWMFDNLGMLYWDQGRLKEAEAMYDRALQGKEKALGPYHTSTLNTVNNLGLLYKDQGRLKEAEGMYQRALQGKEKALGPDHTSTLDTVNNLGLLYKGQGRLKEAEAMHERALQGSEKALGPDHTSTLDTVHNLGSLYKDQGRLDEAEAMYERALQSCEKARGPEHTSTLDTVNNLGLLYSDQGRLKEAEAMYERALQGCEKALGPDHTSTLNTVNNLGILYKDQGRLKEAEAMYERALQGFEKALGPDHTSTLNTVNNLGILYKDQGRLKEAEAMYERALQGFEKALGPDHTSTLNTVNNLGILYKDQGRLKEAEAMYERALQGFEKALGPDHTSTLNTVNNLGILYKDQGRLKEAEAMYERALQGFEKALGPDHTSTLNTVNNLGILYKDQGRLKEAEAMYERALQGFEKALGPDHTSTLNTVNNLGILYKDQGRLKEAEAMYERALQGFEKALGPDHTSTLNTINNLGLLYSDQGRLKEAEAMYDRALQGYEKVLHPDTLRTYVPALNALENLGDLLEQRGAMNRALEHYDRARMGIADITASEARAGSAASRGY